MTPIRSAPSSVQELCHKVGFRLAALRETASAGLPRVHLAFRAEDAALETKMEAAATQLRAMVSRLDELNAAAHECLDALDAASSTDG